MTTGIEKFVQRGNRSDLIISNTGNLIRMKIVRLYE